MVYFQHLIFGNLIIRYENVARENIKKNSHHLMPRSDMTILCNNHDAHKHILEKQKEISARLYLTSISNDEILVPLYSNMLN